MNDISYYIIVILVLLFIVSGIEAKQYTRNRVPQYKTPDIKKK